MSSSVTSKFKKGDKVRRIKSGWVDMPVGSVWKVLKCEGKALTLEGTVEEIEWSVEFYELVKEETKSYREMKPTDLITISIDGNEFEIPIKAMLLISDLTGRVSPNHYTDNFYEETQRILGANGYREFHLGNEDSVYYGNLKNDKGYLNFFKPYYDKQHKEKLSYIT